VLAHGFDSVFAALTVFFWKMDGIHSIIDSICAFPICMDKRAATSCTSSTVTVLRAVAFMCANNFRMKIRFFCGRIFIRTSCKYSLQSHVLHGVFQINKINKESSQVWYLVNLFPRQQIAVTFKIRHDLASVCIYRGNFDKNSEIFVLKLTAITIERWTLGVDRPSVRHKLPNAFDGVFYLDLSIGADVKKTPFAKVTRMNVSCHTFETLISSSSLPSSLLTLFFPPSLSLLTPFVLLFTPPPLSLSPPPAQSSKPGMCPQQ